MLVVSQNSWASITEADSYLSDKIDTSEWFGLSNTGSPGTVYKGSLLISAFYWLIGAPELSLTATLTDTNVKNAQIEAAWYLYEHYPELNERRAAIYSGLTSFKLSKRTENFEIKNIQIPAFIMGILKDYGAKNTTALLLGEYDV